MDDFEISSLRCMFFKTYEYSKPTPLHAAEVETATSLASLVAIMSASISLKCILSVPGWPLVEA